MRSRAFSIAALSLVVSSALAQRAAMTKPDIHGDLVVFTCEGDLWLGSVKDGSARRITSDPGTETNARFSPDGSMIAFTANYDGGTDVYVMPIAGDSPRRLTYDPKGAEVLGWTPDGRSVVFRSRRQSPVGGVRRLWTVPASGGQPTMLPVPQGEFASFSASGKLAYVPVSNEWANWFRYQAGRADDIWSYDPTTRAFARLTNYAGVDTTPVWLGNNVVFVSERSGVGNLWMLRSGVAEPAQLTKYGDAPVRYPGSDGHRVVFQHGLGLAVYDPEANGTTELRFAMNSDRVHAREQRVRLAQWAKNPAIGPTGKRVLVEVRGQIVSVAGENGDFRVLENHPGARAMYPVWAPDGKRFAFVSDRSGEFEIWIGDAAGGAEPRQLTRGLKANVISLLWSPDGGKLALQDRTQRTILIDAATGVSRVLGNGTASSYDNATAIAFSPDGKRIAFMQTEPNWFSAVYLGDTASGQVTRVNAFNVNATAPAFSTDGKFLLFIADTQLSAFDVPITQRIAFDNTSRVYMAPLTTDAVSPFLPKNDEEADDTPKPAAGSLLPIDQVSPGAIEVPMAAGRYTRVRHVPGRLLVQGLVSAPPAGGIPNGLGELLSFDLDKRLVTRIMGGIDGFDVSKDGKKALVQANGGFSVIDATSGPTGFAPINLSPYSLVIDPDKEWRQVFEESWRVARDLFYDPNMHGVDWNAVHRKYAAMLPMVGDRGDLTRLLKDMVSELNAGHAYITDPTPVTGRIPMGFLGIDTTLERGETPALRITKIYRGDNYAGSRSPLAEAGLGVKEGMYILAIAGQRITTDQEPQALLVGAVGQTIALVVNDHPSLTGARTIRVRPLASEDALRYADWVLGRAEYVRTHGGENFGYAHIPDMMAAGFVGFSKGQYANVYKDAMVYDVRYNTGGYVSSLILETIAAKPIAWWQPREGGNWTREGWASIGYKVALCNEVNFSDGELFIETWKRMKIGPVIGKRTGGGEVGSGGGYELADGGLIYVPNYAAFADGKWLVEGTGATPDIEVDQDPAAVMAGRDPQLDKAIEALKARLKAAPIVRPTHPEFPRKELRTKS